MGRHRHQEFIRFLSVIDARVPKKKAVHVIVDNYAVHKHPKVFEWIKNHPRFVFHFTPTSASWLNAVEGFFAKPTKKTPQARRVPVPPRAQKCYPPLSRRHQCKPKALYLDQGAQQNHRRRQTRAPSVRFDPLGNHDTILMVPALEEMGLRVLLNECEPISRGATTIYLAGIDDAHFYRLDNIEKAASPIPHDAFSILLSHTPEIYRQAAHAGLDLLLSGHTHDGQICLPGSIPITLSSVLPRRMGAGAWKYHEMAGYTSVGAGSSIVPVRINCLPEIALHHLEYCQSG
jgi:DDE superfamily endonuclease